jgi:hypothetical protein
VFSRKEEKVQDGNSICNNEYEGTYSITGVLGRRVKELNNFFGPYVAGHIHSLVKAAFWY